MLNDTSQFSSIVLSTRLDAAWSYDQSTGRYRDEKGKFLSQASVDKLVDARIGKLDASLKGVTRMLSSGNITLDQWEQSVREAIKGAHIQAAIVGYGGKDNMGSGEYGRIGQRLRGEYAYLQGFALDLLEQRISTPMALARIGLYAQSVRGSYWQGTELRKQQQGYGLMERVLDAQAKHCSDCLRYAGAGRVSIGTLPLPGQRCECGANCKCSVRYYRQQAPSMPM
jgi:hypothetical protein